MRAKGIVLAITLIPSASFGLTAPDLSTRMFVDGVVDDFAADEWILDETTLLPERARDSNWGTDNDITRVAMTWDESRLYLAVECNSGASTVMAMLQYAAGGQSRLGLLPEFRRNVHLDGIAPNIFALPGADGRFRVGRLDHASAFAFLSEETVERVMTRDARGRGALEMAIPWNLVAADDGVIRFLALITGFDEASAAGDAAPDPSAVLRSLEGATSYCDRHLAVTMDADGDRKPDMGVSPRAVTMVSPSTVSHPRSGTNVSIRTSVRSFAPDNGEALTFDLDVETPATYFVTARVYGIAGRLVRVLYADESLSLPAISDPSNRWDGRDDGGHVVDGGLYIVNILYGAARGEQASRANEPVAIIR